MQDGPKKTTAEIETFCMLLKQAVNNNSFDTTLSMERNKDICAFLKNFPSHVVGQRHKRRVEERYLV